MARNARRLLGGFGSMLPRENFKKWCNLVRFGVYFAAILSKKFAKMFILHTKVIDIVLLGIMFRGIGAFSPERLFFVLKTGAPARGGRVDPWASPSPWKKRFFLYGGGGGVGFIMWGPFC